MCTSASVLLSSKKQRNVEMEEYFSPQKGEIFTSKFHCSRALIIDNRIVYTYSKNTMSIQIVNSHINTSSIISRNGFLYWQFTILGVDNGCSRLIHLTRSVVFQSCRADLDVNQHVSNLKYINWTLQVKKFFIWSSHLIQQFSTSFSKELSLFLLFFIFKNQLWENINIQFLWQLQSIPEEHMDTHHLTSITLEYRRECQSNTVVESLTSSKTEVQEDQNIAALALVEGCWPFFVKPSRNCCQFTHLLQTQGSKQQEIVRARTTWRPKFSWRRGVIE